MGIAGNLMKKEARILRGVLSNPAGPFKTIDQMFVTARNMVRSGTSGLRPQRSSYRIFDSLSRRDGSLLRGQGAIDKMPFARKAKSRVRAVASRAKRGF